MILALLFANVIFSLFKASSYYKRQLPFNSPKIMHYLCPSNAYQLNYTYHIKNQKEDMHPFNYNINQSIDQSIENKGNKKEGCRTYFP
jgi:hypothetical protein